MSGTLNSEELAELTSEQWNLYQLMSDISEECYAAGWMGGCERGIWAMVVGDADSYGMCSALELPLDALRVYAEHIGHWIVWDGPPSSGPRPVPLDEWRRMYADARG